MTLVRVTAPVELPVSLDEARANSRVDTDDEGVLISALISAAVARAERETGQSFAPQTWDLVLDAFPSGAISIPMGPIGAEVSITYLDGEGSSVTVDPATFYVDADSAMGRVVPVEGWPTAATRPSAVRVRFEVGSADCPEDVRQAVLLMVGHWFGNREASSDKPMIEIPLGARALLDLHRRMFV